MKFEKARFDARYHTIAEKLINEKPFKVRAQLRKALVSCMAPLQTNHFKGDAHVTGLLAQQLAFLPTVKSGWGPMDDDIANVAKNMVDCYQAHLEAFTVAEFPAPAQAALEALKDFDFSV